MIVKMSFRLIFNYVLVVAWMAMIFLFSHQGQEVSSGQSMGIVRAIQDTWQVGVSETVVRKSAHAIIYMVLGMLVANLIRDYVPRYRRVAVWSLAIVFLYAISDELHQYFVGGRSGQVSDVVLDTVGGLVGVLLIVYIIKWYGNKSKDDV